MSLIDELLTLYFKNFPLVVKCTSSRPNEHVENHPIPTRRDVEIAVFFWNLRVESFRNPELSFDQVLDGVFQSWVFEHHYTKEEYRQRFKESITTFVSNSVDRSTAKKKIRTRIRDLMKHAGHKELMAFLQFIRTDQTYWDKARLRGKLRVFFMYYIHSY